MRIEQCTNCHGLGSLKDQHQDLVTCPTCHGRGMAVAWGGSWWTWKSRISDLSILERQLENMVRSFVSGLLMVFAVLGLSLGLRNLGAAISERSVLDVLVSRSWPMAAFWFGLLCACYVAFRFERQLTERPPIPLEEGKEPSGEPWTTETIDLLSAMSGPAQTIFEQGWQVAKHDGDHALSAGHILQALTNYPEVASMLVRLGVDPRAVRERVHQLMPPEKQHVDPQPDASAQLLLVEAFRVAAETHWSRVQPYHLFAAYRSLHDTSRDVLDSLGVSDKLLQEAVEWMTIQADLRHKLSHMIHRASMKPKGAIDRGYTAAATPILNQFSIDLTARARAGNLPYIVGRDADLNTMFRIFESRKSGVLLIGDAGVGKTSVLEALAERMTTEDVPEVLQDKRLVALSASAVVAGASGSGQLEGRLEAIILELERAGNIVLAIEHLDQLVGASTAGSDSLDAAQMVAQAVSDRAFVCIATSTVDSYRRYLERGMIPTAFERMELEEIDEVATRQVLQSRVGAFEHRYDVYITLLAVDKAVELAHRYMHEKSMPGPALGLLEEAAVVARKRGRRSLVTVDDVARIVAERTKVQVTEITAGEQEKLLHLEERLHQRVVGQDEAIKAVSDALRRSRAELRDPRRPIATFMFVGPTGVGKTELAKTVAEVEFGTDQSMIRLDMSEFQEVASIERLIGSPMNPTTGLLTEGVRAHPFSLILLDELEKAHPNVLNLFLQVFDDGRLTDANGRTVDFTNTIIIATSNAGTPHIQQRIRDGAPLSQIKTELMQDVLQQTYHPEFINRFDAVILFTPLTQANIETIVGIMIAQLAKQLQERGILVEASPESIKELAAIGFDPLYGARPLRRAVQDHVDNALATFLLQGKIGRRDTAVLMPGGSISVRHPKNQ